MSYNQYHLGDDPFPDLSISGRWQKDSVEEEGPPGRSLVLEPWTVPELEDYLCRLKQQDRQEDLYPCEIPTRRGVLTCDNLMGAICATGNGSMLDFVLEHCPQLLEQPARLPITLPDGNRYELFASPLCLTAAYGALDLMKALLRNGAQLETAVTGVPYYVSAQWSDLVVTPLCCALLTGEEAAARLLLRRGACSDPTKIISPVRCECSDTEQWRDLYQDLCAKVEALKPAK